MLQARKKAVPSPEWMLQLPHKARKLESRLYKSAASLEDYLDRTTLKPRLQKLAKSIVKEFTSQSKLAKKKSAPNETPLPEPSDAKVPPPVAPEPTAANTTLPPPTSIPISVATVPQPIPGNMPVSRNSSISSKNSISEIERQKAVNAKLQEEIMDNIRRQQELVRRLQNTGDGTIPNNNSLSNLPNAQQLMQSSLPNQLSMASGALQNDLSTMLRRHSGNLQFNNDMLRRHSGNLQLNSMVSEALLKNRLPVMPGPSVAAAGLLPPNLSGVAAGLSPNPTFPQTLQQQQQLQLLRNSLLGNSNPSVLEAMQMAQQSVGQLPLQPPNSSSNAHHQSSNGPSRTNTNTTNNSTSLPGDAPLSPNSFNW